MIYNNWEMENYYGLAKDRVNFKNGIDAKI